MFNSSPKLSFGWGKRVPNFYVTLPNTATIFLFEQWAQLKKIKQNTRDKCRSIQFTSKDVQTINLFSLITVHS